MAKYSWPIDERINRVPLYNYNSFEAGLRKKKTQKSQKGKLEKTETDCIQVNLKHWPTVF